MEAKSTESSKVKRPTLESSFRGRHFRRGSIVCVCANQTKHQPPRRRQPPCSQKIEFVQSCRETVLWWRVAVIPHGHNIWRPTHYSPDFHRGTAVDLWSSRTRGRVRRRRCSVPPTFAGVCWLLVLRQGGQSPGVDLHAPGLILSELAALLTLLFVLRGLFR